MSFSLGYNVSTSDRLMLPVLRDAEDLFGYQCESFLFLSAFFLLPQFLA